MSYIYDFDIYMRFCRGLALIFRHKQVEPQVYCQKNNRLLEQNIGS